MFAFIPIHPFPIFQECKERHAAQSPALRERLPHAMFMFFP
jgi:hypothetical protein